MDSTVLELLKGPSGRDHKQFAAQLSTALLRCHQIELWTLYLDFAESPAGPLASLEPDARFQELSATYLTVLDTMGYHLCAGHLWLRYVDFLTSQAHEKASAAGSKELADQYLHRFERLIRGAYYAAMQMPIISLPDIWTRYVVWEQTSSTHGGGVRDAPEDQYRKALAVLRDRLVAYSRIGEKADVEAAQSYGQQVTRVAASRGRSDFGAPARLVKLLSSPSFPGSIPVITSVPSSNATTSSIDPAAVTAPDSSHADASEEDLRLNPVGLRLLGIWRDILAFEMSNPMALPSGLLSRRVSFAFSQAVLYLPDALPLWLDWAAFSRSANWALDSRLLAQTTTPYFPKTPFVAITPMTVHGAERRLQVLTLAAKAMPTAGLVFFALADAHLALSTPASALQVLQAFLSRNPESDVGHIEYVRLLGLTSGAAAVQTHVRLLTETNPALAQKVAKYPPVADLLGVSKRGHTSEVPDSAHPDQSDQPASTFGRADDGETVPASAQPEAAELEPAPALADAEPAVNASTAPGDETDDPDSIASIAGIPRQLRFVAHLQHAARRRHLLSARALEDSAVERDSVPRRRYEAALALELAASRASLWQGSSRVFEALELSACFEQAGVLASGSLDPTYGFPSGARRSLARHCHGSMIPIPSSLLPMFSVGSLADAEAILEGFGTSAAVLSSDAGLVFPGLPVIAMDRLRAARGIEELARPEPSKMCKMDVVTGRILAPTASAVAGATEEAFEPAAVEDDGRPGLSRLPSSTPPAVVQFLSHAALPTRRNYKDHLLPRYPVPIAPSALLRELLEARLPKPSNVDGDIKPSSMFGALNED
jgi:hypothetical protein